MHNGLLGTLLTLASQPIYENYDTHAFGLSPLEDQQLAGLIMWVPASLVHLTILSLLFIRWLSAAEAKARNKLWLADGSNN
jgi:putative membrane protein